jgi:hypothetical protein
MGDFRKFLAAGSAALTPALVIPTYRDQYSHALAALLRQIARDYSIKISQTTTLPDSLQLSAEANELFTRLKKTADAVVNTLAAH